MSVQMYAVIMAGGKGQRFWPLSTSRHPKQVLRLLGETPMIAMAVDRLAGLIPFGRILVVTGRSMVDPIRKALPQLPAGNVVGEPIARDTAAAVTLGTVLVQQRDPRGIVCILTADHVIGHTARFRSILKDCANRAGAEDVLITMGIKPSFPSTGFGYIEAGRASKSIQTSGTSFREVKRFVEKPDIKRARRFLRSRRFTWNSGMFIWSVPSFRNALRTHQPALDEFATRILPTVGTARFAKTISREYPRLDRISVDYAIMEKARNILVARSDFPWSDIGSWSAVADHFPPDAKGNVIQGNCQEIESKENIVYSRERLTALVGVSNLVVVQAANATLICARSKAQNVKQMVEKLESAGVYGDLL